MKRLRTILLLLVLTIGVLPVSASSELTEDQQARADQIAEICSKEWKTYGVLPSVAITQAFIESTLGEFCPGYNLWGIECGAVSYGSLTEGVYAYMEVINNGYYTGAPFTKDASSQIRLILDGGYCVPENDYYYRALYILDEYNLTRYDEALFKAQRKAKKEKARKKQWTKLYRLEYDASLPSHVAVCDEKIIKRGTVSIFDNFALCAIYDVVGGGDGYIIKVSDPDLDGKIVTIEVHEEAKG